MKMFYFKISVLCGFTLCLIGCSQKVSYGDIEKLNGYWEISQVEFPNGQTKEYKVNPTVDFIKVEELKGFKKKVYPKFDGSYQTSNDAEPFTIVEKEGAYTLSYSKELIHWEERITNITDDTYSIVNQDNIKYTYKRYEPINITP